MTSEFADRLESLQQEIFQYRTDINKQISALYAPTPGLSKLDLKNDPRCAVQMLQNEVKDLIKESKTFSKDLIDKDAELKECEQLVGIMSAVSEASDSLMAVEEKMSGADLLGCMAAVGAMKASLGALPSKQSPVGDGAVCRTLRREGGMLLSRFHTRLRRLFQQCVVVERGHVLVSKELKDVIKDEGTLIDSPIALKDILETLLKVGCAAEVVGDMTLAVWSEVLKPLWRERKLMSPRIYASGDSDRAELLYDSIYKESGNNLSGDVNGPSKMPFPLLLEHIGHVLSFVFTEVLCSCTEAVSIAANFLRTSPKAKLGEVLSTTLLAMVPKTEAELSQYQKLIEKPCHEFETKMGLLGWFPVVDNDENPGFLSVVVSSLNEKFVEIRRRETLSRARELVLSDYHNTMHGTGDAQDDEPSSAGDVGDPRAILENSGSFNMQALRFESCQVSLAACRLLKLVHEVMKQAATSSPYVAETLYHSARDCLELFLAVVPSKFSSVIDTVPRMGAVFYNDCVYICHNCTLMTHMYRQDMGNIDPSLKETVGFVDYIPRLRALGEESLCVHLEEQKKALLELLSRVHLSMNHEHTERNSNGEDSSDVSNDVAAAGALVKHVERLHGQWYNVLQESVYSRLASHLVETVIRGAMKPVLECDYISEKSGADISRVFRTMFKLRMAFPDDVQSDAEMSKCVMSWDKFLALTDLLEYTLSDIAEALPKRKFSSFTGTEMTLLIKALFEDSSRRKSILTSILDMSTAS